MTLQSKSKITCITRLVLASMLLAAAWVSAPAQTNTFPQTGNAGAGTTSPDRKLEVLDSASPQMRLTHTDGSVYTDFQTIWSGQLLISPTGADATFLKPVSVSADSDAFRFLTNADTNLRWSLSTDASGLFHIVQKGDGWAGQGTRLTINRSGNVGIGTTNPGRPLVVAADASGIPLRVFRNVNNVGYGTGINWAFNNSAGNVTDYGYVNSTIVSNTAGSENGTLGFFTVKAGTLTQQAIIDQNGKVGIGTNNPAQKFHVFDSGNNTYAAQLEQTNGTASNGLFIKTQTTNVGDAALHVTSNNGALTVISARNNGNVGIGTGSPGYKLDVAGEIRSSSGGFRFPDGSVQTTAATGGGGGSQWVGSSNIHYTGGNVGIGTTNPGVKLDVNGYIAAGPLNGYVFTDDLNTGLTSPAADKLNLVTGGTARLHIDNAGNVGIGTTSPGSQYKLDVAGNVNSSGTITGNNIVAKYQDLAEWVASSERLGAGTVVVLDPTKSNQVISSTQLYDTRVAGVISAQPGITLGESGEGKVLVATTGRVRVKVDASRGPIQIGDLLVTSDVPGVAMKSEPVEFAGRRMHMPGTIIGKALEPLASGKGEILVLLSLQ